MQNSLARLRRKAGSEAPHQARSDLLDLNVLPDRYRPRRISLGALSPWISLVGLALLLIPVYAWFSQTNAAFVVTRRQLIQLQIAAQGDPELEAQIESVEAELVSVEQQIEGLRQAYELIDVQQVAWGDLLQTVALRVPSGVELTGIQQSGMTIRLEGRSTQYELVLDYAERLEQLETFAEISVESIARVPEPEDTASADEQDVVTAEEEAPPAHFTYAMRLELPTPEPVGEPEEGE